jgi:uncharacterized SAM-binding protein YcdF (DUF218 family)
MKKARLGVLALLILVAGLAVFRHAGRWLNREDPLSHAGVIFVLSGGMPERAQEAAKVYALGYAPEIWFTRPDSPVDKLARLGIHFVGEEDYNREILIHDGVPENAIHVLPGPVVNTEEELKEAGRELRRAGKTTVILVTSPQHTRRVWILWQKLVGGDPKATVHAAHDDPFDPDHWWRNTRDVLSVVRESLGLLNAWTGLPVPPHAK